MTPLQLGIMFHYYISAEPYDCKTPTHREQENELVETGLLIENDVGIRISPKGEFWCEHVLHTPLPIDAFVIPERS